MLKELEEQYRDKNVSFLGIAVDNTDKVENFVKNGITFEILIGGNDAMIFQNKWEICARTSLYGCD